MLKMGRFIRRSFLNNLCFSMLVIAALFCMNYSAILGIVSGEGWLLYMAEDYIGHEGIHPGFFSSFAILYACALGVLFSPILKKNTRFQSRRVFSKRFHRQKFWMGRENDKRSS